ncbi:MAG: hypothetical protein J6L64_07985 [Opitutales bacterium]|nr:hypothetical protein [Opitutales bacterium]
MNLPTVPSNFSSGETLSAARLNQILNWMHRANEILSGAKKRSATASGNQHGSQGANYSIPHPFHVRVIYNGANPTGIAVSGGGVFMSIIPSIHRYSDGEADVFIQNGSFVESYYQDGKTINENPSGKKLYWTYDRATGKRTFELTAEESGNDPDAQNATIRVKIAEFEEADGITLVSQFLRSDIFVTCTEYRC